MKMIKQLSEEIKHNIHEAREKIEMAYRPQRTGTNRWLLHISTLTTPGILPLPS